jgi:hypothetical protein
MSPEEKKMLDELRKKEAQSTIGYDPDVEDVNIPNWIGEENSNAQKRREQKVTDPPPIKEPEIPLNNLGKVKRVPMGMESEWKNIPIETLPSKGFGYPEGFEMAIRPALVSEIRHYSTVDEADRIDLDEKLNHILEKCMRVRWNGGMLDHYDLWYEDRFFVIMSIRDYTFLRGENRILLPLSKNCKGENCNLPDQVELKANILESFVLGQEITKRYDKERYCFNFVPKDGSPEMGLFIPTVGVTTKVRKILLEKTRRGKKFDKSFAEVSTFVISDWRDLDEKVYDAYERTSAEWTPLQFSIADQMSKQIMFATKSRIYSKCESCGGEVTASITFPGGYRSLFVISNIIDQLL